MSKVIPLINLNNPAYQQGVPLRQSDIPQDFEYTFNSRNMSFDKDLGLKGSYCYHPFNTITVDKSGDVYMCICQAWLPISVGKIWEFESLTEIVQSSKARKIQSSILDGSYRYCDHNTCSILKGNLLENKIHHRPDSVNWINFSIDSSCNLTCPSCRIEFKFISEGTDFDLRIKTVDHLIKLIEQHDHTLTFTLAGDGDPFASLIYRHFLSNLNLKDNTTEIEIVTNGILLKSHWHKLNKIYNNIIRTKISFDAGSESVYNITRRGGDWNKLLESSKFLNDWKKENHKKMIMTANFVVQTANYKDMPAYVDLCNSIGFDEIHFQKIVDWGTFQNFKEHAVWQSEHPNHNEFLQILKHPSLNNSKINFTNLK